MSVAYQLFRGHGIARIQELNREFSLANCAAAASKTQSLMYNIEKDCFEEVSTGNKLVGGSGISSTTSGADQLLTQQFITQNRFAQIMGTGLGNVAPLQLATSKRKKESRPIEQLQAEVDGWLKDVV